MNNNSSLGRFVSADTLIPQPSNPMAWDRYAYALNNPLRYTDPSGHETCTSEGVCIGDREKTVAGNNHHSWLLGMINNGFGVTMKGNWTTNNLSLIYKALYSVGRAFARTIGDGVSLYRAFKQVYGINNNNPFTIEMDSSNSQLYRDEGGNAKGGVTLSSNYIVFAEIFYGVNNIIHELGHAFSSLFGAASTLYNDIKNDKNYQDSKGNSYLARIYSNPDVFYSWGFNSWAKPNGTGTEWQQNPSVDANEIFADQFLGWTFNTWFSDPTNINYVIQGEYRAKWMDAHMTNWLCP